MLPRRLGKFGLYFSVLNCASLRRNGRHYKVETQNKTHWTLHHYGWLERTIEASSGSLKVNLELLVRQLKGISHILTEYGQQIEALAKTPRYEPLVQAFLALPMVDMIRFHAIQSESRV